MVAGIGDRLVGAKLRRQLRLYNPIAANKAFSA
jgi:hypothetical protein